MHESVEYVPYHSFTCSRFKGQQSILNFYCSLSTLLAHPTEQVTLKIHQEQLLGTAQLIKAHTAMGHRPIPVTALLGALGCYSQCRHARGAGCPHATIWTDAKVKTHSSDAFG